MTAPSSILEERAIGSCRLILGDCLAVLPEIERSDAVITDPPYGARTHAGHDAIAGKLRDGTRSALGYTHLTEEDCAEVAEALCAHSKGWIVWMTCSDLGGVIRKELAARDRYAFAPLPFFHPGSTVRLTGDGPSSWTTWIMVARTRLQCKWGTLPGGYAATGEGWGDKVKMGGKPTRLMQYLVRDYSREGDTVCDPFMGSGTTGVACIRMNRGFVGIESNPEDYQIACERIGRELQQGRLF